MQWLPTLITSRTVPQRAVRAGSVLREAQVFRTQQRQAAGRRVAGRARHAQACACSRNAPPASTA